MTIVRSFLAGVVAVAVYVLVIVIAAAVYLKVRASGEGLA